MHTFLLNLTTCSLSRIWVLVYDKKKNRHVKCRLEGHRNWKVTWPLSYEDFEVTCSPKTCLPSCDPGAGWEVSVQKKERGKLSVTPFLGSKSQKFLYHCIHVISLSLNANLIFILNFVIRLKINTFTPPLPEAMLIIFSLNKQHLSLLRASSVLSRDPRPQVLTA